ncbi:hypothetical protein ACE1CD_24410 [Aerosakkonema sp. BLCC-F183]|uniref:hypothetical protein n=1 Tax=Aerosakkonema sp. BLCC-F183 TaxID=3342834 RepID=UPI0035B91EB8
MSVNLNAIACQPHPVDPNGFNPNANIPYSCTTEHIRLAMNDFIDFLGFINQQLYGRGLERFETMLMPANFSSLVGEFMITSIPKYCTTIAKNQYHNGHPDLIPTGMFPNNAVQYASEGIEVKASRYLRGWQGHNPEAIWLMVFVFDSNRPSDTVKNIQPKPFRFVKVCGAMLTKNDWSFSGRSGNSRRTITASINNSGYQKMSANWIYQDPSLP